MSQKYPYTNTGDDYLSHQDMYADSYKRPPTTYQPGIMSSSQEQTRSTASSNRTVDSPVNLPGKALSFLHSCGLDPSDLAHLAELPEHLITVETLPSLLLQVKERKLSSASSSRPSTSQPLDDTSAHSWEGSSHTTPVEYPIDRPVHPVYPLPPEQVQTWQDRWGNPRRTSSLTTGIGCSSSKSGSFPDYSISMDSDPYCNATESPEPSSHSFVDSKPRPLLSLKLEPPIVTPTKNEASDFNCKIPPAFPHVCQLCDISIHSSRDWLFHVRGSEHAKCQLELVKKYPKWDQTVESARNESSEVYKVPTRKEASDFNGVVPPVFPYLCVLCNITVFSEKDWSAHVTSGQHAQSQLDLMAKYPVWDGTVQSSRRNDGHGSTDTRDGTSKGNTSDMKMSHAKDEGCSRVVSFTPLPAGEGITSELTAIAKRFGSVRKSLFLTNQGYVEMSCLAEAEKLVEHYSANRLKLKGKLIQVTYAYEYNSLREAEVNDTKQSRHSHTKRRSSPDIHSIQRDSSSPRRVRSSDRTPSSPKRRHSSDRTHSSHSRRHSSDRTSSSPKRKHSSERTHSSPKRKHSSERTHSSPKRKHSSERTHSSPKRKSLSERTCSSPKRKSSSERTHSSPKRRRSSQRTHTSPKRSYSLERTHSSRSHQVKEGEDSQKSRESTSTSSPAAKAESTKSSADTEEQKSVSNNNIENMDSDSDLEGLEVIADDGEELARDIDDYELTSSDQENLPSEPMDVTDIHTEEEVKTGEDSPNADTPEISNCPKEDQKFDEHKEQEITEEDHDFSNLLENCVTLDEFTEENFSDCQESDEAKPSILQNEQSDKEPESPKEQCTSKTTAENPEDAVIQPKEEHDQERVTEDLKENFGNILEVKNLPSAEDYTDLDFLNIIKRYGDIMHHVLFRSYKKGFVEMALASDAERVAADSKNQDIALRGKVLKIKVSEKYCHLPEDGCSFGSDSDDEEIMKEDVSKSDALNGNTDSSNESLKTDEPVGTEFVRPVVGYFCNLCNVIYATEEEAKDEHCKSPAHREKVKEHKEKSGSVKNKK
ncbi:matrin 3-like 1.1 isoform X2 [Hemibagrus wyckioides]|uniref:matrin 3-like 1.1 isoform X2 n=1 Tax=Hemibagrus wyckioides TaxID=337641 RepID=UPI00266BB13D|nr:matrin 3-like 1.1 isoform X2 [Hemibagrus wyckioides]